MCQYRAFGYRLGVHKIGVPLCQKLSKKSILFFETPFLHEKTEEKKVKKKDLKKVLVFTVFRPFRSHVVFSHQIFKYMGIS
jgi:hypothetical protein